jgi:phosphatidylglycerol---prolipoprotein diacylglyceryl transferase
VAQAIGRLGNWFNNELYGKPTDLPWALKIYRWDTSAGHAITGADGKAELLGTFQPTFLYELLWNVGVALLVIWADRRFRLSHGRAFALYVAAYCAGRLWIEMLRIDTAEHFLGLRLNVFTSIIVGLLAVVYLVAQRGRPREVITRGAERADSSGRARETAAPAGSAVAGAGDRPAAGAVESTAEGTGERRTTTSPDEGGPVPG